MHKAGVIAVLGKPNVGKSTLVNRLVGQKVSIVSAKPQTTRKRVLGIASEPEYQIVFVDTPGIHKPKHKLGAAINEQARQALHDIDCVLVVVDVAKMPGDADDRVAKALSQAGYLGESSNKKVILCMNKMDQLKPENVERHYEAYKSLFETELTVMTSMTRGHNVDILLGLILENLPENPSFYPDDSYTDQPERFLAAELVREKALHVTKEEIPHSIATYVESWEEEPHLTSIQVVILVERDGQKAIVIGKKGSMAKKIGTEARLEIEEMLGKKVFLEIFVKVRADWRQNPRILRELDLL